jgi:hypothetical protein
VTTPSAIQPISRALLPARQAVLRRGDDGARARSWTRSGSGAPGPGRGVRARLCCCRARPGGALAGGIEHPGRVLCWDGCFGCFARVLAREGCSAKAVLTRRRPRPRHWRPDTVFPSGPTCTEYGRPKPCSWSRVASRDIPSTGRSNMRRAVLLTIVGGLACSVSQSTPIDGQSGQDLAGGDQTFSDGQSAQDLARVDQSYTMDACILAYPTPGCGANTPERQCDRGLACLQHACSCDGHVITGCHAFPVPYAYETFAFFPGDTCDPNPDGSAP